MTPAIMFLVQYERAISTSAIIMTVLSCVMHWRGYQNKERALPLSRYNYAIYTAGVILVLAPPTYFSAKLLSADPITSFCEALGKTFIVFGIVRASAKSAPSWQISYLTTGLLVTIIFIAGFVL